MSNSKDDQLDCESGGGSNKIFHYSTPNLIKTVIFKYQSVIVLVLTPIIGSILFLRNLDEPSTDPESIWNESTAKCAFVLLVMAFYWSTQAIQTVI